MRETEIKQALQNTLLGLSNNTILEEVEIYGGTYRADMVDASEMHCYEIKSAGDTLARLIRQGNAYCRVFDKITLVTAECHLNKALTIIPSWWGVIVVYENSDMPFKIIRNAIENLDHEPYYLTTLLKKSECLSIMEKFGGSRGWKSKSLYMLHEQLARMLPLDSLRAMIKEQLITRAISMSNQVSC